MSSLLAKLQEKQGPQKNSEIQLIKAEPRREYHRVVFITRGGIVTGEDRMTQGKTTEESGIRKATEKTQTFDAKKEKQMFKEARREFMGDQGSSSKTRPEVREYGMPLAFDQSTSFGDGKEASKLVSFLYTFIEMIKDEKAIQELQNLVRQYEIGRVNPY
jgi:hypothetical protein